MVDLKKIIIAKKLKKFILKKPIIVLYHYNNMNSFDWISLKKDLCTTQINILKIKNKWNSNKSLVQKNKISLKQKKPCSSLSYLEKNLNGQKDNNELLKKNITIKETLHTQENDNKQKINIKAKSLYLTRDSLKNTEFKNHKIDNLNYLFQGPTLIATCDSFDCLQKLNTSLKKYKKFVLIGGEINNQKITHLDLSFLIGLNESVYIDFLKSLKIFIYKMLVFQKGYNFCYYKISSYKLIFILHYLLTKNIVKKL